MKNDIMELKAEMRALAAIWRNDYHDFDGRELQRQVEIIINNNESGIGMNHYRNELKGMKNND